MPTEYPDGSDENNAAKSGYDLKKTHPELTSGYYWIKNTDMKKAEQMYVDMDTEGGGYDFLLYTGNAIENVMQSKNVVPGLDIIYPRSKEHIKAMLTFLGTNNVSTKVAMRTCGGVHRTTGSGSYIDYPMNSESNVPDWKVPDGGRWWLSDSPYSEPNGDYKSGGLLFLDSVADDGNIIRFNDSTNVTTGETYILSTNAHP